MTEITIIQNTDILTMEDGPVLRHGNLWLQDGKILKIEEKPIEQQQIEQYQRKRQIEEHRMGEQQTEKHRMEEQQTEQKQTGEFPENACVLDGEGCTVIPGLIDAHCHYDESYMGDMFLASGVTSVRNMRGYRRHAEWRDEILAGKRRGPYLYSSGPICDGEDPSIPNNDNEIIRTEEDVEAAIRYVRENDFLWMKTYPSIEPELYRYLLKRCQEEKLPMCGHMTKKMDPCYLADHGYICCEHTSSLPADPEKIRYLAESGMWFCPTHVVCETLPDYVWNGKQLKEVEHYMDLPECVRERWEAENQVTIASYREQNVHPDFQMIIDRALTFLKYSKRIMAGSDCPYAGIVPGFSMADELERLTGVYGMEPYEALCAATCYPAQHMGIEKEKGRILPGMDADLVLLEGNPLEEIGNVRRIRRVFQGTRSWDKEALQQFLSAVSKLKKEEIEFIIA